MTWDYNTIEGALTYYAEIESEINKETKSEAQRHLCRTDLFYFLVWVCGREDMLHPWLFDRCREVQDNPDGYLDLWSRGHYKSTSITFAKTIQDILINPEITIGIFAHTRPIAKGFLKQIKRELETNITLKNLFPDILFMDPHKEAPMWSEDGGLIVKRKTNPKEATLEAHGLVDGQPTSKHFKLRVYDDVVTRESVSTKEQIDKTTEAWELSQNLGMEGGIVRVIGTRYHLADTYSTMIERKSVTPRIYTATHNGRMDGNPVFLTDEAWANVLRDTSRSTIASQQLQNPLADEDATFRVDWLRPYEVRPRTMNVYLMCDPSKGRNAQSDNTAIAVIGVSSTGNKYLLDGYCHRMTLSQRWTALRDLYKKWTREPGIQLIKVGYERYGSQSDDEYFTERMLLENKNLPPEERFEFIIHELNWTFEGTKGEQGKTTRVERLEPDFRNAKFFLPFAVWRNSQPMIWKIDTDLDSKTYNTIVWDVCTGWTKGQKSAIDAGSSDLVARAIKRLDEERHTYDLTMKFMDEYQFFPFGRYKDLVDACFVAGTLIATARGNIAIENIIIGDRVITPDGWKNVTDRGTTGIKSVVRNIGLIGTANHPVFHIDKGYVMLDTISSINDIVRLTLCDLIWTMLLKLLNSTDLNIKGWEESVNTIYRSQERLKENGKPSLSVFISLFGNFIQERKYQKVMRLIILIATHSIMIMKTWSVYRAGCIGQCLRQWIEKRCLLISISNVHSRLYGINQKKGVNGIKNMLSLVWRRLESNENIIAKNVTKYLYLVIYHRLNIVPAIVGISPEKRGDIKNQDIRLNVPIVGKKKSHSTKRLDSVHAHAQTMEQDGQDKVYNITVEDAQCYFANGILVHNCSRIYDLEPKPPMIIAKGATEPNVYFDS